MTEIKESISDEIILNSYPPTKEQFINAFRDSERLTALCEATNRCPICYDEQDGENCEKCNQYYLECTCTPLTSKQILDDDISPCPKCGCETVIFKDENWICEKCNEVMS